MCFTIDKLEVLDKMNEFAERANKRLTLFKGQKHAQSWNKSSSSQKCSPQLANVTVWRNKKCKLSQII